MILEIKGKQIDLNLATPVTINDLCLLEDQGVDLMKESRHSLKDIRLALTFFVKKVWAGATIEDVGELDIVESGKAFKYVMTSGKRKLNPS